MRISRPFWSVLMTTMLAVTGLARAQAPAAAQAPPLAGEYTLGVEDQIAISVWMHPELDRTVAIQTNGSIVFPPLGEIKAAGLTTKELQQRLSDRLSSYLRSTSTVTVTIAKYMARSVIVSGAVYAPGRYGFENIPNLLDVLNGAGGPVPGADLTRVQVIRRDGPGKGTHVVDVLNAQRAGTADSLITLMPGDAIVVQSFVGAYAPAPGDGFAVLGEVSAPGIYQAGQSTTIWGALAQAHGITQTGDMSHIKIVTLNSDGQQVVSVNLKEVLNKGGGAVAVIKPGDVVYVPHTKSSVAAKGWVGLTQLLSLTADLVNIVIIADYLNRNPHP